MKDVAKETWAHYRKTAIPIQLLIISICTLLVWKGRLPLPGVLFMFLVMQVGSVLGALWATRLRRKVRMDANRLPLGRR